MRSRRITPCTLTLAVLLIVAMRSTLASAYCLMCVDACNCGPVDGFGGTQCTVQIDGSGCRCMVSGMNCSVWGGPRPFPTDFKLAPSIPEEQSGVIAAVSTALITLPAGAESLLPASRPWRTMALADHSDFLDVTVSGLVSSSGALSDEFAFVGGLAMMQRSSGTVIHRTPANDGYAIRVLPATTGSRVLVRIMQSGAPSGGVVDVVLTSVDDALLVPLTLEGRCCVLAIQALVLHASEVDGVLARQNDARALTLHQAYVDGARRYHGPSDAMGEAMEVVQ